MESTPRFEREEVIRRARSRIGENRYRLLSNNCEHFCEWCLRGEHRSEQVERIFALPRRVARLVCAAAVALLAASTAPRVWADGQQAVTALSPNADHSLTNRA